MKKTLLVTLAFAVAGAYTFGAWYYYRFPKVFPVVINEKAKGVAYISALIQVSEEFSGNWMPNDIFFWPSRVLDNPQNFQRGELEAVRYATRVLRDNLSRMRTTDAIDPDCEAAFTAFSNDPERLIYPRAEWKYGEGVAALTRYRARLESGNAHFYPRSDNLREFDSQFISLLGGASQRLANAPRDVRTRITEETAGDVTLSGEKTIAHHTPWLQIDDSFYFVRGELYVLRHLMEAIRHDFVEIITQRKAEELLKAITDILEHTQFEPLVVVNGNAGSFLANHSLQLQARLEDARQKMRSLQSILEQ